MHGQASLYEYWAVLYRRKKAILLVGLAAFLFALGISWILPPVYEAKAAFYLPRDASPAAYTGANSQTQLAQAPLLPVADEKSAGVNIGILKSKDIAERVHARFPGKSADALRKSVDIVLGSTFLIDIYARDRDPKRAAAIANAYADAYQDFHRQSLAKRSERTSAVLKRQLDRVDRELADNRRRMAAFQERNALLSSKGAEDRLDDLLQRTEQDLDQARVDLASTREKADAIRRELVQEQKNYRPGESLLRDPQIDHLQQKIKDLQIELAGISVDLKPNHRRLPSLRAELKAAEAALQQETRQLADSRTKQPGSIYESLRQQLMDTVTHENYLEARVTALTGTLGELHTRIGEGVGKFAALDAMQAEDDRLQTLKSHVEQNLVEATMQAEHPEATVVVAQRAQPPAHPAFPLPLLNALVALVLGLVCGCYYALFLEYLQRLRRTRMVRSMDLTPLEIGEP